MTTDNKYVFKRLEISGYKSIQDVVIEDVPPLMVLAGSNGSGKSNFVDALNFLSKILVNNVENFSRENNDIFNISFVMDYYTLKEKISYALSLKKGLIHNESLSCSSINSQHDYKKIPKLKKSVDKVTDAINLLEDKKNTVTSNLNDKFQIDDLENLSYQIEKMNLSDEDLETIINLLQEINFLAIEAKEIRKQAEKLKTETDDFIINTKFSLLQRDKESLIKNESINIFISTITNIEVFRINHNEAKKPSIDNQADLKSDGSNIASVLALLENDDDMRETILDWLSLIVPEMQNIVSDNRHIDGSKMIQFEEESGKKFPAHLVSDGTIYALCMLVAVLTRTQRPGITIIEEPERGLHPKAIGELVGFMREHATTDHPIILTTHSESVVRELELDELFFVNKENGNTHIKSVKNSGVDKIKLPLDTAWLTNTLDGGLPW